jgi:FtsP/CotA-like multicopper oxidase with cupredoxin domain
MSWRDKSVVEAWRNRQEIINAKLSRRELARLGLLTASGALVAKAGLSARAFAGLADENLSLDTPIVIPPSPPNRAWVHPLPLLPIKEPVAPAAMTGGPPDGFALIDGGTRRVPHQAWQSHPPQKHYELFVREASHSFHPDWPASTIWGFDGRFPGPQFDAHYGEPILVRYHNRLPANHVGFGIPEITTHLHNAHTPTESDGNPVDFFGSVPNEVNPGFRDQHYPNMLAGGDPREALSSLWYHDHHIDFTAQNLYKGLVGFYCLHDDLDAGDELTGLRLPSGPYDIPIMFMDMLFGPDYQPYFDLFNTDGIIGDKFTANGAIQPYCDVKRRRYRFRLQNTGPSRWYNFALFDGSRYLPFYQIANDGNLLPQPVLRTSVQLSVAERADIIVDFAKMQGSRVYLVNRAEQVNGRGPTGRQLSPGTPIIQFNIGGAFSVPDPSMNPTLLGSNKLRDLPDPDFGALLALAATARQRTFNFERGNGAWMINKAFFNPDVVSADPGAGTGEVWTIRNPSGGWRHPIHIHFEEHRILSRNGKPPPSHELGRKDVIALNENEEVKIFMRFRDFKGRYVMHCHNVVHEDHSMMMRWDIV